MPKILFIWNVASVDGNIGSYRPSVFAAKSIGFEIDIAMNFSCTPIDKRKLIENELKVRLIQVDINRNPYSLKNYVALKQLIEIMKKEEYDIIHCNTPVGGILGRLAAYKVGNNKVFYMNRGFAFYKGASLKNWIMYYNVEKIFARLFTDAIATINPDDFKYAKKFKLRNNSGMKYSLPGPGVEVSRFDYNYMDRKRIRKQFQLQEKDILILSVGEITKRKNFASIVDALGKIKKEYETQPFSNHIYYMIVGEGPCREMLYKKACKLHIKDKVIFAGYHENISQFYSAADIFALPSLSEGFGRVGIEAMNVGLPLITSSAQGINLYSINGKTGYKYKSRDVKGYENGLLKLIKDKNKRNEISEFNREFAKSFSMEKTGREIAKIYKDLMQIK